MRLRVKIPCVEPSVMKPPPECPYDDCEGKYFKAHQLHCEKAVRDTKYEQVEAYRRECLSCHRTHRVYPQGVSQAQQTDRLKGLSVLLYVLGISYRGVADAVCGLGIGVSHSLIYRNVQAAGQQARHSRQAWVAQHAGKIRVVGGDLTYVKRQGEELVIGVAVDAQHGITLDICVLDDQSADSLKAWLGPILEQVGADVLLTDDADGFKEVADAAGTAHQVCRRHVTLNVLEFVAKTVEHIWDKLPVIPPELDLTPDQLLADLEMLEWILLGHPEQGGELLADMYTRYVHAPSPKKGKRASLCYRMRNHILRLCENWSRLTCYHTLQHSRQLDVDETNNTTEQIIGWSIKERYRTMRGYKRDESILNLTALTHWLAQQHTGYDMSPILT